MSGLVTYLCFDKLSDLSQMRRKKKKNSSPPKKSIYQLYLAICNIVGSSKKCLLNNKNENIHTVKQQQKPLNKLSCKIRKDLK